jgi:hypothetical protein
MPVTSLPAQGAASSHRRRVGALRRTKVADVLPVDPEVVGRHPGGERRDRQSGLRFFCGAPAGIRGEHPAPPRWPTRSTSTSPTTKNIAADHCKPQRLPRHLPPWPALTSAARSSPRAPRFFGTVCRLTPRAPAPRGVMGPQFRRCALVTEGSEVQRRSVIRPRTSAFQSKGAVPKR